MPQTIEIITKVLDGASQPLQQINKRIETLGKGIEKTTTSVYKFVDGQQELVKSTESVATGIHRFQMHLLSIMFFGFILQRTMQKITSSTVSTFMKITEGQTLAAQGINALSASWELLKFSIGNAIASVLEPLLPILLPIIEAVADFVQQNPVPVFAGIVGLLTLGTFLSAIGQIGLFMQGLTIWKASSDLTKFTGPGGGLEKITNAAFKGVGIAIAITGIYDLVEGNILKGLKEVMIGAGLFMLPTPMGRYALVIGGALAMMEVFVDKGFTAEAFLNALIKGVGLFLTLQPHPLGKVLGIALLLIPEIKIEALDAVRNRLQEMAQEASNTINKILKTGVKEGSTIKVSATLPTSGTSGAVLTKGTRQAGGFIPRTGPYILHQGETVLPRYTSAGVTIRDINVNVTAPAISSDIDTNEMARKVSTVIMDDIKKYANSTPSKFLR